MVRESNNGSHVLVAFLSGAAAGATTALLLAPKSGRETREQLAEAARKGGEQVSNFARHRRDQTAQLPSAIAEASEAAREAFVRSMNESEARLSA